MCADYSKVEDVFKLPEGDKARIKGWVYRHRAHKDKVFAVVRDSSGIIQVVIPSTEEDAFKEAVSAGIEAAVEAEGVVKIDARAPGGKELHAYYFKVLSPAKAFPITESASREFLLDVRHLWVRSRKMNAVLKIRSTVFGAIHEYFRSKGYYEVQGPMFITAAVEGGATLFEVDYLGERKAYLTQSSQFYLEALIYSLEKVYTIAPSFRAEKSRTRRHLTEFWHAEAEVAWAHLEDILRVEEELVSHIVAKVLEENQAELRLLGRDTAPLEEVKPPFPRISYDEALQILERKGFKLAWGDDFGADEERVLTEDFDKPFFIYGYPVKAKAFYHKNDPKRPEVTLSADMLAPEGYGEIIGGGERIESEHELVRKIIEFGLDPKDYEWYIDLRRYGSVPHAGFGLGVDRLVMWICGLDHIVDAIPFPRTIRRLRP